MQQEIVFERAAVLDVVAGRRVLEQRVVVAGGRIARVEPIEAPAPAPAARVIDCAGRTLMPGLCDAHVHVIAWTANLGELNRTSAAYTAARADLLLVDGDPLGDLGCLRDPERCLELVMKRGVIYKHRETGA